MPRRRPPPAPGATGSAPVARAPGPPPPRSNMHAGAPRLALLFAAVCLVALLPAFGAVERFPPPDFTGGHVLPETVVPASTARSAAWLDVAALAAGLALASWISLRLRSRAAMVVLSLASLAYFGFWRRGCVCAIGSIQNVALGIADPGYAVPLAVLAFFALPLLTALVWGRGFCAGVCPHGALQDLVLVKPLRVPRWLDEILRLGPWLHLGLGVLLAATGGLFIICKYDPFVPIFRLAGPRTMLLTGAALLALAMFVGRPYCRWLCPYGALLGLAARVARWRPTVTPDACTRCRLCETACPFGALVHAAPEAAPGEDLARRRRRLATLAVAVPLAAILFGWLGGRVGLATATLHPDGRLAALILASEPHALTGPPPDELTAWRQAGADRQPVLARAAAVADRASALGTAAGAVFGLVLALKLASLAWPARPHAYDTDRARCLSCARCFSACPYELIRRGIPVDLPSEGGADDRAA